MQPQQGQSLEMVLSLEIGELETKSVPCMGFMSTSFICSLLLGDWWAPYGHFAVGAIS